jgi:hypothetical protein
MGSDTDIDTVHAAISGESHPNAIHLLRTMQAHHVTLSAMADQKANILIGVNSVIFALLVKDSASLTLPMLILAATSGLAAVLCMLAVVPAIGTSKTASPPNLLFFGAFTRMPEAEWQDALDHINTSDARIRQAMAHDVYQLGMVLQHKKYRYLGWGYRVFIVGLVLTFVSFAGDRLLG